MHDSQDGQAVSPDGQGNVMLLVRESPSDVCLLCHADSLGAVLGSDPLNPPPQKGGGNFVYLLEDNLNDGSDGAANPIFGDAAGHNLVAPGHFLAADSTHALAPGGTFPSSQLGCTSCHDPHGSDSFRMLYGVGSVMDGVAIFTRPAPEAEGISLVVGAESPTNHTACKRGLSEWCGNCHGDYHVTGGSDFGHPGDRILGAGISDRYNLYNGDDDPFGGAVGTAYLAEVPFEDLTSSISLSSGPSAGSSIMCLSCHRAHASSAPASGRWDFNVALLRDDGVVSGSYRIPDPYNSPNQGPLCSKCHDGGAGGRSLKRSGAGVGF
jgi:hypothetical protein